jgi:hypothetical protein
MMDAAMPDELMARCKADPAFRVAMVRQMEKTAEEARFVEERMREGLARIKAACAIEIAQSAN